MTDDADTADAADVATAEEVQQLTEVLHQQAETVGELAEQQQRIMDLLEAVVAQVEALDDRDLEESMTDALTDALGHGGDAPGRDRDNDEADPGRGMFR